MVTMTGNQVEVLTDVARRVEAEIGAVIVGQRRVVRAVVLALMAGGHVLLEGVPGLGKTQLVRALGSSLGLRFARIQFTPDLMPADVVGTQILVDSPTGRVLQFQTGPVFANIVLADEVNRATPRTQSALLEAMQERQVTAGGETRPLPEPFMVLATQNPIEMEGTYPLPEAQMDRFLFKVQVPYPSLDEVKEIALRTTGNTAPSARSVAEASELLDLQRLVRDVPVAEPVLDYAARLVMATHPNQPMAPDLVQKYAKFGASPRALQAMAGTARARALLEGRLNVAYADIRAVAPDALRHRLILSFEAQAHGISAEQVLEAVLAAVLEEAVA